MVTREPMLWHRVKLMKERKKHEGKFNTARKIQLCEHEMPCAMCFCGRRSCRAEIARAASTYGEQIKLLRRNDFTVSASPRYTSMLVMLLACLKKSVPLKCIVVIS